MSDEDVSDDFFEELLESVREGGAILSGEKEAARANLEQQRVRFEKLLEELGEPSLAATKAFLSEREIAELEEGLTDEIVSRAEARMAAANKEKVSKNRANHG